MRPQRLFLAAILAALLRTGADASDTAFDRVGVSSISAPSISAVTFASDILLNGAGMTINGAITGQSSMTASAFFGNGERLTGVLSLTSTQTATAAFTFLSSFTIRSGGRRIVLSTSSSVENMVIAQDGILRFYPELHNSTSTVIQAVATTAGSAGVCISTLTLTSAGGRLEISFTGTLASSLTEGWVGISFLIDGAFVGDMTAQKMFASQPSEEAGFDRSVHLNYLVSAPAPGTHNVCVSLAAPYGGTASILTANATTIFWVKEIR